VRLQIVEVTCAQARRREMIVSLHAAAQNTSADETWSGLKS
jgi:hypothetical protein